MTILPMNHLVARIFVAACLYISAGLTLLAHADTTCAPGSRVNVYTGDAHCIYLQWPDGTNITHYTWNISNQCTEYGEVHAMVIEGDGTATDVLVLNTDGTGVVGKALRVKTSGTMAAPTVFCCTDGDGICKREDAITDASCKTGFDASTAAADCTNVVATVADGDALRCTVTASCLRDGSSDRRTSTRLENYVLMDTIINCDGWLAPSGDC